MTNGENSNEILAAREQQIYTHGKSKVLTLPKSVSNLLGSRCRLLAKRINGKVAIYLTPISSRKP